MKRNRLNMAGISVVAVLAMLAVTAGCGKKQEQSSQVKTVRVGAILPLTGPAASLGEDEKLGIELAHADYARASTLAKFVFEDSQSKPDVTISALRKQLDVDGTRVFVIATTAPVQAALPALKEAKNDVLAIVSATMPDVTVGYPFAYRIYPTVTEEVATIADYAGKKGYRAVGGFAPRNRVGEESLKMLTTRVQQQGGSVLLTETVETTQKDFRSSLARFKEVQIDAVCMTGFFPSQYAPILKQMIETGINVPILCGIGMVTAGVEKELPSDVLARIVFVAPPLYLNPEDGRTGKFMQAVRARGKAPNYEIGYAYDTTTMLLRAIESANSSNPQNIAAAMNKLVPFEGVTGTITFNDSRDAILGLRVCRWGQSGIALAE